MVQNFISQQCHRKPSCYLGFCFCFSSGQVKPPTWVSRTSTESYKRRERPFFTPERGFGSELVYLIPRQTCSHAHQNERKSFLHVSSDCEKLFFKVFYCPNPSRVWKSSPTRGTKFKESLFVLWLFLFHNKQLKFADYTF